MKENDLLKGIFLWSIFLLMMSVALSCVKKEAELVLEEDSLVLENKLEQVLPHFRMTYRQFGEVHNELLDTFYSSQEYRSLSVEGGDVDVEKFVGKFIEVSLPVMKRLFDLDTISTSTDSLKSFLNRELQEVVRIQKKDGLYGVEKYLDAILRERQLNNACVISPLEFGENGTLRNLKLKSTRESTPLEEQKARLYQSVLTYSDEYWNSGFRISGGTKAIVADAAFGVLAWTLGPWSIVAAGCASAMVNEGEANCVGH